MELEIDLSKIDLSKICRSLASSQETARMKSPNTSIPAGLTQLKEFNIESTDIFHIVNPRSRRLIPDSPEKTARIDVIEEATARIIADGRFAQIVGGNAKSPDISCFTVSVDSRLDGIGHSKWHGKKVHIDAPYGLVLEDGSRRPIAVVGIEVHRDHILVTQLQGVRGASESLALLGRWEKSFVALVEELSQELNVPEVRIRPADQIGWVTTGAVSLDRARLRYDVTAKRMGYRFDDRVNMFVKRQSE